MHQLKLVSLIMTSATVALILISVSSSGIAQSCNCPQRPISFRGCTRNPARFRVHEDDDIGLGGECLPSVPANEIRCFKWRAAEGCPGSQHLRCSLTEKHRGITGNEILLQGSAPDTAILSSPGYNKTRPQYYNNNLCIYSISLRCSSGERIRLTPKESTPLADSEDYLWFSKPLRYHDQYIRGNGTVNFRDEVDSHSFLVVLLSNSNKGSSRGRFQIQAQCSGEAVTPPQDLELSELGSS